LILVFTRMLRRTNGRTDGSVTISLRNFGCEGIKSGLVYPIDFQGHRSKVKVTGSNF
jgi:hypothetical protein